MEKYIDANKEIEELEDSDDEESEEEEGVVKLHKINIKKTSGYRYQQRMQFEELGIDYLESKI